MESLSWTSLNQKTKTSDRPFYGKYNYCIKVFVPHCEALRTLDHKQIDHVLQLITNKAMTSRDIQVTLKRSREHTSRLMKKLFEDGYVERNTETKPYTYSITEKGKAKVEEVQTSTTIA